MTDQPGSPEAPAAPEAPTTPASEPAPPERSILIRLYDDLVESLTEPRWFYTERYPRLSYQYALGFGLAVNWLAAMIQWVVSALNHQTFLNSFLKIRDQLLQLPIWRDLPPSIWAQNPISRPSPLPAWLAEASAVALHPFSFLISIVVSAIGLVLGSFLFIPKGPAADGPRDPTDISHFMKLAALTATPSLVGAVLSFLPFGLGSAIGWIYGFCMLVFAVSLRYRVSTARSFAVVVAPWFLLFMTIGCFLGLFGALLVGLFASLFGFSS